MIKSQSGLKSNGRRVSSMIGLVWVDKALFTILAVNDKAEMMLYWVTSHPLDEE